VPGVSALAIDVGGSHVTCAVVRGESIIERETLAAYGKGTLQRLLPSIGAVLTRLLQACSLKSTDCAGIVMGFCGIVNPRQKRVLATNDKFTDANDVDLNRWFTSKFSIPFLLENDARLALLGEHACGAARGVEDAVMVTLGTGIGASAMLNGRLLQSRNGLAGMIGGHLPVVLDGGLCTCGNRGCAESEAATVFLRQIWRRYSGERTTGVDGESDLGFAELFGLADRGDQTAASVLDHCRRVWSVLTVALIHAYDPEVVVFGGSVMKRAADILPGLQKYVDVHAWTPGRTVPLRASALGSDAALLGAIPLIESIL
jgi:glucokinase